MVAPGVHEVEREYPARTSPGWLPSPGIRELGCPYEFVESGWDVTGRRHLSPDLGDFFRGPGTANWKEPSKDVLSIR